MRCVYRRPSNGQPMFCLKSLPTHLWLIFQKVNIPRYLYNKGQQSCLEVNQCFEVGSQGDPCTHFSFEAKKANSGQGPFLHILEKTDEPTFELSKNGGRTGVKGDWGSNLASTSSDWTGEGWYRFNGQAGSQMATKKDVASKNLCGTAAPGYINLEDHPNVDEGKSQDVEVCFYWWQPCWRTKTVKVANCSDFYVYRLPSAPDYESRYCGVSPVGPNNFFRFSS